MREAVIVSAVRTPVGKAPKGTLRATRPDDLAAIAIQGALGRVPNLDHKEVEDVIIGCGMPHGPAGNNVARIATLRAGLPVTTAAVTVMFRHSAFFSFNPINIDLSSPSRVSVGMPLSGTGIPAGATTVACATARRHPP